MPSSNYLSCLQILHHHYSGREMHVTIKILSKLLRLMVEWETRKIKNRRHYKEGLIFILPTPQTVVGEPSAKVTPGHKDE